MDNPEEVMASLLQDMQAASERMRRTIAEHKRAERSYVRPNLDVPWWNADTSPFKVWQAHGLTCALAWGFSGVNGYVLLPRRHPWMDRDNLYEVDVHGGVTFGPHVSGWVGFDTAHGGDDWPPEAIEELQAQGAVDAEDLLSWELTRSTALSMPWTRRRVWSVASVQCETERLALRAASAPRQLRLERRGRRRELRGYTRQQLQRRHARSRARRSGKSSTSLLRGA